MGAAQQCRSEACKPVAPVWARIAGASPSSTVDDYWRGPAECAAFVEGNAGGSIEIPSKLPFSPTEYTITSQNCGALVANWAISFGLTSEAECMTRCDLPGCESTDPAAGCATLPPPPSPHATPTPAPTPTSSNDGLEVVLVIIGLIGVGAGLNAKGMLGDCQPKPTKASSGLSESIYEDDDGGL
jgi:hypothetical protein